MLGRQQGASEHERGAQRTKESSTYPYPRVPGVPGEHVHEVDGKGAHQGAGETQPKRALAHDHQARKQCWVAGQSEGRRMRIPELTVFQKGLTEATVRGEVGHRHRSVEE